MLFCRLDLFHLSLNLPPLPHPSQSTPQPAPSQDRVRLPPPWPFPPTFLSSDEGPFGAQCFPQDLHSHGLGGGQLNRPGPVSCLPLSFSGASRRPAPERQHEHETVPTGRVRRRGDPRKEGGCCLEAPAESPPLRSLPHPSGQGAQRYPRAGVPRLPVHTHLAFTSTALPPDCSPGFPRGATSPAPPLPRLPRTWTREVPTSLPTSVERWGNSLNPHSFLCPFPEGSTMWEWSSDHGQPCFSILIPCTLSKPGPPPAPPAPCD